MNTQEGKQLSINGRLDCSVAEQTSRRIAHSAGFRQVASEEIVLAGAELASNPVKHGRGGIISFRLLDEENKKGIEIESRDDGPGMSDIGQALVDGYSTTGS